MKISFKRIVRQVGRDFADSFDVERNLRKTGKQWRDISRLIRGKSKSKLSGGVTFPEQYTTPSSAKYPVGNTGFHRVYPSMGVSGAY